MKFEWKTIKCKDIIEFNPKTILKKGALSKKISMDNLLPFTKQPAKIEAARYAGGSKFINNDTILARITPCLENGKTAYIDGLEEGEVAFGSTEFIVMRSKRGLSDPQFVYYLAISPEFRKTAIGSMTGSSGRQRVQLRVLEEMTIKVPSFEVQQKIGLFLKKIDDKIIINNKINDNFEA